MLSWVDVNPTNINIDTNSITAQENQTAAYEGAQSDEGPDKSKE